MFTLCASSLGEKTKNKEHRKIKEVTNPTTSYPSLSPFNSFFATLEDWYRSRIEKKKAGVQRPAAAAFSVFFSSEQNNVVRKARLLSYPWVQKYSSPTLHSLVHPFCFLADAFLFFCSSFQQQHLQNINQLTNHFDLVLPYQ